MKQRALATDTTVDVFHDQWPSELQCNRFSQVPSGDDLGSRLQSPNLGQVRFAGLVGPHDERARPCAPVRERRRPLVTDVGALTVVLASGEKLPARVRVVHPQQDLALLQVAAPAPLRALPLRDSEPRVGEWVVALGNPFGLGPTATIGIIGATGRSLGRTGDAAQLVQTDAAINPGNSGGPLVDMRGNAIAVANAAVMIGQGIGFGIPIQLVVDLLRDLKGP